MADAYQCDRCKECYPGKSFRIHLWEVGSAPQPAINKEVCPTCYIKVRETLCNPDPLEFAKHVGGPVMPSSNSPMPSPSTSSTMQEG